MLRSWPLSQLLINHHNKSQSGQISLCCSSLVLCHAFGNFFSMSVHQSWQRMCILLKKGFFFSFNVIVCDSARAFRLQSRAFLHRGRLTHKFLLSAVMCKGRTCKYPLWGDTQAASKSIAHITSSSGEFLLCNRHMKQEVELTSSFTSAMFCNVTKSPQTSDTLTKQPHHWRQMKEIICEPGEL